MSVFQTFHFQLKYRVAKESSEHFHPKFASEAVPFIRRVFTKCNPRSRGAPESVTDTDTPSLFCLSLAFPQAHTHKLISTHTAAVAQIVKNGGQGCDS